MGNKYISVVKVTTEAYQRGDSYLIGKTLRTLKKKSNYDFLKDECDGCGVFDALARIVNLHKVDDGEYLLVTCNECTDYETGYLDDWDLKLVPYTGDM